MTNELFEAYKGQLSPKEARAFSERVTRMTPQQKQQLSSHLGTMFHEIRNRHIKPKEDIMMTAQIGGEFKASDMFVPTIEGEKISYEGLVPVDQQTYVVRDQPTRNPIPQKASTQRSTPQRSSSSSPKTAPNASQTSKVGVPAMLARPQEQPVKLSGIQDLPKVKGTTQEFNRKMTGAITSIPQERTNKFKKIEVEGESLLLDPATGYAYSRNPNGTYRVRGNFETPPTPQAKTTSTVPKATPKVNTDSMFGLDPESAVVNSKGASLFPSIPTAPRESTNKSIGDIVRGPQYPTGQRMPIRPTVENGIPSRVTTPTSETKKDAYAMDPFVKVLGTNGTVEHRVNQLTGAEFFYDTASGNVQSTQRTVLTKGAGPNDFSSSAFPSYTPSQNSVENPFEGRNESMVTAEPGRFSFYKGTNSQFTNSRGSNSAIFTENYPGTGKEFMPEWTDSKATTFDALPDRMKTESSMLPTTYTDNLQMVRRTQHFDYLTDPSGVAWKRDRLTGRYVRDNIQSALPKFNSAGI